MTRNKFNHLAIRASWIIGGIVIVLAIKAGLEATNACNPPIKTALLDDITKANGCVEFWINRYQTSIQTAFSSLIGAVGLLFIIRQLGELSHQNEMTRAALAVHMNQQEIVALSTIGKAQVAVGLHASMAGTLMLECIAIISELPRSNKSPDYAFFGRVTASVADVYPALRTPELKDEWKILKTEAGTLMGYILAHRAVDKVEEVKFRDYMPNAPDSIADAYRRTVRLNEDFLAFAKKIDA